MTLNHQSKRYAATVGTFDGVHRGHRSVIDTLRREAEARKLVPLVITFDAHPLSVIAPERVPKVITSTHLKREWLEDLGAETRILDFSPAKARQSASDWIRDLHEFKGVDCIVIGYDNTFGHDGRSLAPDAYKEIGAEAGVEVIFADELEGVSSSAIRKEVSEGNIEEANRMLGHPFTLDGIVEEGDRIGRTLGVPTANLHIENANEHVLPPYGVYASEVELPDGRKLPGVTNIGMRPSVKELVSNPVLRIETHILDYDGPELYGKPLKVALLQFMRPEKRFGTLAKLKAALHEDVMQRRNMDKETKEER